MSSIINHRLINQQIAGTQFTTPQEIVQWMGAMQAQDYAMAKWAIGLRVPGLNDAALEKAFNDGSILRTHLLRPTWHFVSPKDIRWMITLTAPRINALNAYQYRQFELDAKLFKRCNNIFVKALQGGNHLTRTALAGELEKAKIKADGIKLICIMMRAELDGILCSGPRHVKQFTYALLEERVPPAKPMLKQEALAKLTGLYFTSRGPATVQDFATWGGLTVAHAKEGINLLKGQLTNESIQGKEYWLAANAPHHTHEPTEKFQSTFLMPNYDEYAIGYKDRSAVLGEKTNTGNVKIDNPIFNHALIVDGIAAGTWKHTIKGNKTLVETTPPKPLSKTKQQAVAKAVKRYLEFVDRKKEE